MDRNFIRVREDVGGETRTVLVNTACVAEIQIEAETATFHFVGGAQATVAVLDDRLKAALKAIEIHIPVVD